MFVVANDAIASDGPLAWLDRLTHDRAVLGLVTPTEITGKLASDEIAGMAPIIGPATDNTWETVDEHIHYPTHQHAPHNTYTLYVYTSRIVVGASMVTHHPQIMWEHQLPVMESRRTSNSNVSGQSTLLTTQTSPSLVLSVSTVAKHQLYHCNSYCQ